MNINKGSHCKLQLTALVSEKEAFSIETVIMAGHTLTLFSLISFCSVIRLTRRPSGRIQPQLSRVWWEDKALSPASDLQRKDWHPTTRVRRSQQEMTWLLLMSTGGNSRTEPIQCRHWRQTVMRPFYVSRKANVCKCCARTRRYKETAVGLWSSQQHALWVIACRNSSSICCTLEVSTRIQST